MSKEPSNSTLLSIIDVALDSGQTTLDLSGKQVTLIPSEIGRLTALENLDLSRNQLIALPPEIGRLTALKSLNLSANQLTALPPEIGRLTALKSLNLSANQLTALPPEVGRLTALEELSLQQNHLTALPSEIGQLTTLIVLILSGNQLTAVPSEIGRLRALRFLFLSANHLTALPPEIGRLTALERLDLSENQLTALPSDIAHLSFLEEIHLKGNELKTVPPETLRWINRIYERMAGPTWRGAAKTVAKVDAVEFGVSYQPRVQTSTPFVVDAWVYRQEERDVVVRRAQLEGAFRSGGGAAVSRRSTLTARLDVESCDVRPASQKIYWTGSPVNVSFAVSPREAVSTQKLIGTCSFFLRGLRLGQVIFQLSYASPIGEKNNFERGRMINSAFASYASEDRRQVLARVQGIEKLGVNVFVDVHNLKSNDPYPVHLLERIDTSDVLYLFWSLHARRSKWVEQEWRYGMGKYGLDFIDPVPLVDPRKAPPPSELGDQKHFNDWVLAYIEAEKSASIWRRFAYWLTN